MRIRTTAIRHTATGDMRIGTGLRCSFNRAVAHGYKRVGANAPFLEEIARRRCALHFTRAYEVADSFN